MSYRTIGTGSVGIICIHGWMMNGDVFNPVLDSLKSDQTTIVVPHQRGSVADTQGATDFSLNAYVDDILAIVQETGLNKYVLIGHSMGGQIAQLVAAQLPEQVSGLVLINSVPLAGMQLPEDAAGMFRNSGGNRDTQGQILGMACTNLTEDEKNRLLDLAGGVSTACIAESFDAWTGGGDTNELAKIQAQTLVIATDDPFLPPEFLQQAIVDPIANAQMRQVPGCGHYPQCEQADEMGKILKEFLATQDIC